MRVSINVEQQYNGNVVVIGRVWAGFPGNLIFRESCNVSTPEDVDAAVVLLMSLGNAAIKQYKFARKMNKRVRKVAKKSVG